MPLSHFLEMANGLVGQLSIAAASFPPRRPFTLRLGLRTMILRLISVSAPAAPRSSNHGYPKIWHSGEVKRCLMVDCRSRVAADVELQMRLVRRGKDSTGVR